jgi:hypothetical protein
MPMTRAKSPLFFHLAKASREEPPIQNEEFLRSYVEFGSSLRSVTAYQQHKVLRDTGASMLERFAALCAFYQAIGNLYEDLAATAVAFTSWAKNRSLLLADIYERTFLTSRPESVCPDRVYHDERAEVIASTTKTVKVCAQQFFESLGTLTGEQLLQALGIPWKHFPSVKLVPREFSQAWEALPEHTKELLRPLADKKSLFLTTSYNKLKHGPQMVVMNPFRRAIEQRGITEIPLETRELTDRLHVRLLFDGARTQELPGELEDGKRVAPFLFDQPDLLEGMLINLVSAGHIMRLLAWWLYKVVFGALLPNKVDPMLAQIGKRFTERLSERFGSL